MAPGSAHLPIGGSVAGDHEARNVTVGESNRLVHEMPAAPARIDRVIAEPIAYGKN
ncbi:MAG TPA: hypothetical protein VEG64_08220 [Candidatus Sulfotelmatobacter sp.]|nr:hypothetical protein [Candidatus Sulfotelmatobacter sp.]